ncbi:MAG: hypothetical protein AVO33_01895 [delta proteobacterium ML8_F1]|nr:MAG: hypothetical protein AVO33_01895 [delta proteobacterium ML8_F1]
MIGSKIREMRKRHKMTLSELAKRSGFTASYISQIERDIIQPSLTALKKLSVALESPIYSFLDFPQRRHIVTRAEDRVKLELPDSSIAYEFVSPMVRDRETMPKMEIVYFRLEPRSWTSEKAMIHDADESVYVLKGALEIHVEEEQFFLEAGDSIYIRENAPHRYFNPLDTVTEGLAIVSPAIY